MSAPLVGREFDFVDFPATTSGGLSCKITGRFEVIDFEPDDPSVGIFGAAFSVCRADLPPEEWTEADAFGVDPYALEHWAATGRVGCPPDDRCEMCQ
jgi:hypothetical protein